VIRGAGYLFAASQVLSVRFTNLRYFFSQFGDALFDGPRHGDRLAECRNMYGPPANCKKNVVGREQSAKMYPAS
jgi:hypothetical protein